jgi:hypothetical protein
MGPVLQINHLQVGTRGCWAESMLDRLRTDWQAIFRFGMGRIIL